MTQGFYSARAAITAIGTYVPERIISNGDLETMVDTNHEWIVQRTGIVERRAAAENQFTSDMCFGAVRDMLARYPVTVEDVDYILVATTTPDTFFPSVASRVQAEFNIASSGAIDIQAACSGFVASLQTAAGLLASGTCRKILVVGAETLTKITDYTDRSTCILFGDGAGAVLVEADQADSFLAAYTKTEGNIGHHVYCSNLSDHVGGVPIDQKGKLVQNGREVYKWAVTRVSDGVNKLLEQQSLTPRDIDWFIPHSANLRIIEAVCERTGITMDQTLYSLVHYGNTSAASIPLALDLGIKAGKVKPDQQLLLYGFGGGLTQSALLLKWTLAS
ncbi:ketoacyl-ACP synthase III [Paenibacillus sp. GCM10012307]|uniref:Beta-ketoacyl-[acyl-carrier-protein] synthase III n=1 Tax=Paenibacillus roseus TaxID=2798579 RepID=A0A934MMW3_9BACL|nr:ketoacyl-ACP synthase III [Paenibacillus roseus]MBJ6363805.1 ketoacyl-ACP synthase III [Paenibacillus roseus]